jgi:Icc-related predicted phosphoesterase
MKVIAFGDIHEDISYIAHITDISVASCVIVTGDLTNVGGIEKAKEVIHHIRLYNSFIYAQAGNFDRKEVETYLNDQGMSLHGNGFIKGDIGIFGVGGSNRTPFNTPNEFDEHEMEYLILRGYNKVKDSPLKILVSHAPPFNTLVDITKGGRHVGSKAIREFIENYQPNVCISGHIHEGKGSDTLGKTVIINPGLFRNGGYVEVVEKKRSLRATLKG